MKSNVYKLARYYTSQGLTETDINNDRNNLINKGYKNCEIDRAIDMINSTWDEYLSSTTKVNKEIYKQIIYDCIMELNYHQQNLTDEQIADKLSQVLNCLERDDK